MRSAWARGRYQVWLPFPPVPGGHTHPLARNRVYTLRAELFSRRLQATFIISRDRQPRRPPFVEKELGAGGVGSFATVPLGKW